LSACSRNASAVDGVSATSPFTYSSKTCGVGGKRSPAGGAARTTRDSVRQRAEHAEQIRERPARFDSGSSRPCRADHARARHDLIALHRDGAADHQRGAHRLADPDRRGAAQRRRRRQLQAIERLQALLAIDDDLAAAASVSLSRIAAPSRIHVSAASCVGFRMAGRRSRRRRAPARSRTAA
jgi:hypothetical protein